MNRPVRLSLSKDLSRHIRGGHPWIWADALAKPPAGLAAGSVVDVLDRSGRFLARGLYDPGSPIAVRVFTLDAAEVVSATLVRSRVFAALAARRAAGVLGRSNALRLVHGEGDYLPGIVCDLYRDTAVVRFDGEAARTLAEPFVSALCEAAPAVLGVPVTRVYQRSGRRKAAKTDLDPGEAAEAPGLALAGDLPPRELEIHEGQARFVVDVVRGQKTGFFLDQRDNRHAVARYAAGAEVLNCFAYTGGFSIHCALAGARRVTSVDLAKPALEAARVSFRRSGLDPAQHEFLAEDCYALLARLAGESRRFGVVILDPPSFAASAKALPGALKAYTELAVRGLAVVEPGGILATASCSSHVTPDAFLGVLRDAAQRAARAVRVLELRGAGADHPVVPGFPEGRYLKMLIAHVA